MDGAADRLLMARAEKQLIVHLGQFQVAHVDATSQLGAGYLMLATSLIRRRFWPSPA